MNRYNRCYPLLFSALLLLAACGQDAQPAAGVPDAATPGFSFSVDPAAGSVKVKTPGPELTVTAPAVCENGTRTLTPGNELELSNYKYAFLPGNLLKITASFKNTTLNTYEQPFTFSGTSSNVVSTTEPEVTDADLGGDGKLSPSETTTVLTFTVEHKGQAFTYGVSAEAAVNCAATPVDPSPFVDLTMTQEGPETAQVGNPVFYTFTVMNNGTQAATGVTFIDSLYFEGDAVLVGRNEFCGYNTQTSEDERGTYRKAECALPDIPAGEKFIFEIYADFSGAGTATNRAEVTSTEPDQNPADNADEVTTVITAAEPEPDVCADPVSIPDANLQQIIRDTLNKQNGSITCEDMSNLTTLYDDFFAISNIKDLTGLQYAVNLTSLGLSNNQIGDISVLGKLTGLRELFLYNSEINDVSALKNLSNLQTLYLDGNQISDVTALKNNAGLGDGSDVISLINNCLTSTQAQNDIATLEARNPSQQNIYADPQGNAQCPT